MPLMLSIAWYSLCQFVAGFSPSFTFLLVMRTLLGFGMGAEWPAGAALAMESWPERSRGLMSGALQGSWNLGFLLASIAYGALFDLIGWRGLFWMGILPALAIVYIRTFVKEPEVWVECQKRQREQQRHVRAPLVRIFRPPLLGNILSASWWMISSFVVYYSINALFATHLQQDLHFTPAHVAFPIAMTSLLGLIFSGVWGRLSDHIGRRWSAIVPGLLTIPVAALYLLSGDPRVVVWGFILQGAFGQAIYWLNPIYLAERFPTEVRGTASAFCYHIGAIFGGAVPLAVTVLAGHGMGLATAMLAGTVVGAISFCLALLTGPETRGTKFVPDLVVA